MPCEYDEYCTSCEYREEELSDIREILYDIKAATSLESAKELADRALKI